MLFSMAGAGQITAHAFDGEKWSKRRRFLFLNWSQPARECRPGRGDEKKTMEYPKPPETNKRWVTGEFDQSGKTYATQQRPKAVQPLEWLTAMESAEYLKVKVRTLLNWVRQGKIKGYALSGTKRRIWRFLQADLDAALLGKSMLSSSLPSVLEERKET
jgi:excisionase family DNA binding protein